MEYEIKVIVPNAEAQMAFCNKLAMYRFHWMSEQKEFAALNANEEDDIDSSTDYWFE